MCKPFSYIAEWQHTTNLSYTSGVTSVQHTFPAFPHNLRQSSKLLSVSLKFYKSLYSLVSIPPLPARWKAIFEGLDFYDNSNYCNTDRVLIPFGCNKYYNQVVEGLRNFHLPSQCNGFVQGK